MAHVPSLSLIRLASVDSTNSYLAQLDDQRFHPHGTLVRTTDQRAGRGQRGNTWESEPGKNVTMSMLLRPRNIAPRHQFVVSEIASVALVMLLRHNLPDHDVRIKWPNDIYVDDKKICGILIEHTINASGITRSIVGIGLNVNQLRFVSDAPNPVSMAQLSGTHYDIDDLTYDLGNSILELMERYDNPELFNELHDIYCSMLWRRNTPSRYIDIATGDNFTATIDDVDPDGILRLLSTDGVIRKYAFKEVAFVL